MFLSLGVVFGSLLLGYGVQRGVGADERTRSWAKRVQRAYVLAVNPLILMSAFWAFSLPSTGIVSMPFLGALALFLGGGLGLGVARWLELSRRQAGSMFVCGMFSNLGSIGALIAFLLFGEAGFALAQLYRLFEHMIYYAFGFPFADLIGQGKRLRPAAFFGESFKNPLTYVPFAAIGTGLLLQAAGVDRPAFLGNINAFLIPASAGFMMFGIGLTLRFKNAAAHPRLVATLLGIKFVAVPLVIGLLAYGLGYGQAADGMPMRVTIIQSMTPVAFFGMTAATLFDLDEELAQACWMVSTALMLVVIPLFYLTMGRSF